MYGDEIPPSTEDTIIARDPTLPPTRLSFDTPPRHRAMDLPSSVSTDARLPLSPTLLRDSSPSKSSAWSPRTIYSSPPPKLLRTNPQDSRDAPVFLPNIPQKGRDAPVSVTVQLDLDYKATVGGGPDVRQKFEEDFIHDLAVASQLPEDAFRITNVGPGSVVVQVEVLPHPSGKWESPAKTVAGLVLQAKTPNSALLAGTITGKTMRLVTAPLDDTCPLVSLFDDIAFDSAEDHSSDTPIFAKQSFAAQRSAVAKRRQNFLQSSFPDDYASIPAQNSEVSGSEIFDDIPDYALPNEDLTSRPDPIQDGPTLDDPNDPGPGSFMDTIMQSSFLSWLSPSQNIKADHLVDQLEQSDHNTAALEAVLSSRGQVDVDMCTDMHACYCILANARLTCGARARNNAPCTANTYYLETRRLPLGCRRRNRVMPCRCENTSK